MDVQQTDLPILDEAMCRSLLATQYVGRLGYVQHGRAVIVPVNYRMSAAGDVDVLSRPGAKLDAARSGAALSLQIDGTDPLHHAGWSVLVTGRATVVDDLEAGAIAEAERLRPWPARRPGTALIRIHPELIEGRRLR